MVKRNKAKAELAMAKAEDPMPLRMAKIHQEAAVRKVTKATVKAGAATAAAETAAKLAVEARVAAEKAAIEASQAAKDAEDAIPAANQAFVDAEAVLEEVKAKNSGTGEGNLWSHITHSHTHTLTHSHTHYIRTLSILPPPSLRNLI